MEQKIELTSIFFIIVAYYGVYKEPAYTKENWITEVLIVLPSWFVGLET